MAVTGQTVAARAVVKKLRPVSKRTLGSLAFEALLWLCLLVGLVSLMTLLVQTFVEGSAGLSWNFLTNDVTASPDTTGLFQSLMGSLYIMLITIVVAFPLGVGTAIYLEEYARPTRFTTLIQVNIRNLAAVPSIVYGVLGLALFVPAANALFGGSARGKITLTGGITIAILVTPIIVIASSEAIRAVPRGLREGALGLGSTRWQMIRTQVLPNAMPGILTGSVLAVSRGLGESAPLILVGGLTGGGINLTVTPTSAYTALPLQIFDWTTKPQFLPQAASAIIVLLGTLLVLNGAAILLRNRYQRSW